MRNKKPTIYFHYTNGPFYFQNRTYLKSFLIELFRLEDKPLEALHYIFCSDKYLLKLNEDFLHHDTYTDIITFPLSEPTSAVISDIYISTQRVKENATALKIPFVYELHRVIFHGALHLCGYKDKTKMEKKLMRQKEDFYLHRYFVPRDTVSF